LSSIDAGSTHVDTGRLVERLLGNYSDDHRNPINQRVHWVCVPLIIWTVFALVWVIPVPEALGRPGLWAGLAMAAALGYYFRLSRPLALALLIAFSAYAALTWWLHQRLGTTALLWTAVTVFVLAWVGQFIGHEIEGRRPTFLTDLQYLLIGPLWLVAKLMRRLGIAY
jgi:uncharacterized membrane protein YGL010W